MFLTISKISAPDILKTFLNTVVNIVHLLFSFVIVHLFFFIRTRTNRKGKY